MEAITFEVRKHRPITRLPSWLPNGERSWKRRDYLYKAVRTMEPEEENATGDVPSQLRSFPVLIKPAPVNAPFLHGADLLIAAVCTAFACGAFHNRFLRDRVCVIGCPKLDGVDYAEKLTQILLSNNIRSITVAQKDVPCCGGLSNTVKTAAASCGREIPTAGEILD